MTSVNTSLCCYSLTNSHYFKMYVFVFIISEVIQSLPALLGSRHKLQDVSQLRMYYSKFDEYVDITLKLLILECWEMVSCYSIFALKSFVVLLLLIC